MAEVDRFWECEHRDRIVKHKTGIVGLKDDSVTQNSLQEQQNNYKCQRKIVLVLKKLSQMIQKIPQLVKVE